LIVPKSILPRRFGSSNSGVFSSEDKISAMRLDDYYQTYRPLAAYITFLDQVTSDPAAPTTHYV
jgi:hypothetical protein